MRRHLIIGLTALGLGGCADQAVSDPGTKSAAMLSQGEMMFYRPGVLVPQDELFYLGPPEALGGEVLEGDVRLSGRIDYVSGPITAGIFQAAVSGHFKVRITMPFTEHGTIIHGTVTMTDENGLTYTYKPGDSYLIKQGTVILWEQDCPLLQKSFYNVVE